MFSRKSIFEFAFLLPTFQTANLNEINFPRSLHLQLSARYHRL